MCAWPKSMGPQRVVIPDLVGNSERAAEINIRRRGLELGSDRERHSERAARSDHRPEPSGECGQRVGAEDQPADGRQPDRDSFVMPDLVGRSEDDAINEARQRRPARADDQHPGATPSTDGRPTHQCSAAAVAAGSLLPARRMVVKPFPRPGQRIFAGQGISVWKSRSKVTVGSAFLHLKGRTFRCAVVGPLLSFWRGGHQANEPPPLEFSTKSGLSHISAAMIASASISTSISGEIIDVTTSIVADGRMSPNTSPCALPTCSQ